MFQVQLRQDRRLWEVVRGVVRIELVCILSRGCLVSQRKLVMTEQRVTPNSPISTADQIIIPWGPQPAS